MAFLSKLSSVELPVSSVWDCLSSFALFDVFSPLNKQLFGQTTTMFSRKWHKYVSSPDLYSSNINSGLNAFKSLTLPLLGSVDISFCTTHGLNVD